MYITNFERDDGFGGQYQTIIFSIIYSEIVNKEFVYSPFKKMEHNYNNDLDFLDKKEKLINILENYKTINEVNNYDITSPEIYKIIEANIDKCVEMDSFKKAKNLFFENKPRKIKEDKLNVSVHIRRANPHDNGQTYGYTGDEYFLNCLDKIRKEYKQDKIFHIYSQGNINSFEKYKSDDTIFHLNEKLEDTFYDLTTSDVLVMSKGSFSYMAGLLCDGDIYYLPFWHTKLNKWKII